MIVARKLIQHKPPSQCTGFKSAKTRMANPLPETNPNPKTRFNRHSKIKYLPAKSVSGLGIRAAFGLRISIFGFNRHVCPCLVQLSLI